MNILYFLRAVEVFLEEPWNQGSIEHTEALYHLGVLYPPAEGWEENELHCWDSVPSKDCSSVQQFNKNKFHPLNLFFFLPQ